MHYRTVTGVMVLTVMVLTMGLSTITGCGGAKTVKTVDVSGTVYLDDKPLADVSVHFVGREYSGYARSGADGKYQLKAQPGENKLFFAKYVDKYRSTGGAEGPDDGQMEAAGAASNPGAAAARMEIPAKYADMATSGMTYNVPEEGATNADLKLSSK